jgi:hypothetical protein
VFVFTACHVTSNFTAVIGISKLAWQVEPDKYEAGGPSHEVAACALARSLITQNKTLSLAMSVPGSFYNEDFFMSQCYQKVSPSCRVLFLIVSRYYLLYYCRMWLQVRVSRNYQKSKQLTPRSTDVKQTQGKRITIADRKRSLQESGTQGKPRGKPRTKRYHKTTLLM